MPPAAGKRAGAAVGSGNERKLYTAAVSGSAEPGTVPMRARRLKQLSQLGTRLGNALTAKAAFLLAVDLLMDTHPRELLAAAVRIQGTGETSQGTPVDKYFTMALDAAHDAACRGSAHCAVLLAFLVDGLRAQGWEARLCALLERPSSHWHDPVEDVLATDPRAALVDKVRTASAARLANQALACLLLVLLCSMPCPADTEAQGQLFAHQLLAAAGIGEAHKAGWQTWGALLQA